MRKQPKNNESDRRLMTSVREGDLSRLGVLFERYHKQLYTYLVRMTHDPAASEDLLQETFVNIIRYRHTFRDDSRFTAWMFNIARNLCYARFRANKSEHASDGIVEEIVDPATGIAEHVELESDLRWLSKAIGRLPFQYREVLLLSRYHELKYDEIAEILGCSVSAVKVRVHRAVKELRKVYIATELE